MGGRDFSVRIAPKVSVVIPFYNCAYVNQAIESALNQSYPHIEVIVVNDGSTRHVEKITPYVHRIRYIEKANGGTASALNAGIRNASGTYFAWLSSDDFYDRHKIASQIAFMQSASAFASHTAFYFIDAHNRIRRPTPYTVFGNRIDFFEQMKHGCLINGSTVMLSMDVFDHAGLFDESLRYAHDYEFWLRVLMRYDFLYMPQPLLYYRVHSEMGSGKFAPQLARETLLVRQKYQNMVIHP